MMWHMVKVGLVALLVALVFSSLFELDSDGGVAVLYAVFIGAAVEFLTTAVR